MGDGVGNSCGSGGCARDSKGFGSKFDADEVVVS